MRKFLMVAAAAAIALVGLSANTCGEGEQKRKGDWARWAAFAAGAQPPAQSPSLTLSEAAEG